MARISASASPAWLRRLWLAVIHHNPRRPRRISGAAARASSSNLQRRPWCAGALHRRRPGPSHGLQDHQLTRFMQGEEDDAQPWILSSKSSSFFANEAWRMAVASASPQAHGREAHISSSGKARSEQPHPPPPPSCRRRALVIPRNLSRLLRGHMAFWRRFLAKAGSQEHFLILIVVMFLDTMVGDAWCSAELSCLACNNACSTRPRWGNLFSGTRPQRQTTTAIQNSYNKIVTGVASGRMDPRPQPIGCKGVV